MKNNVASKHQTSFLRAVELIENKTAELNIPSENWCYPMGLSFGDPHDIFYSEMWHNGMDYTRNAWMVYTHQSKEPSVELVSVESFLDGNLINTYDFHRLLEYFQISFRNKLEGKEICFEAFDDLSFFTDLNCKYKGLTAFAYEHVSQKRSEIALNVGLLSESSIDYIFKVNVGSREIVNNT